MEIHGVYEVAILSLLMLSKDIFFFGDSNEFDPYHEHGSMCTNTQI